MRLSFIMKIMNMNHNFSLKNYHESDYLKNVNKLKYILFKEAYLNIIKRL